MSYSGSISGTTDNQYIVGRLDWTATDDVAGNYTDVYCEYRAWRTNTGYTTDGYWGDTYGGKITCEGVDANSAKVLKTLTYNSNTLIQSHTFRVNHAADGSLYVNLSVTGGLTGTTYETTSLSGGFQATTLLLVPAAPTAASVSRVSDTSHSITWTNNPATRAPYENVILQRWDSGLGVWATTATLGGSVASYTDTTTQADREYQYRVKAKNSAGSSDYAQTSKIKTTPATPSNCAASKATTDIVVTWTDNSDIETGYEVWHAANGTWDGAALTTTAAGATTYTHIAPNASQTHKYRVRATTGTLTSAYSNESNTIQLLAAPLAPTNVLPSGTTLDPNDGPVTVTWQHNPVDSTAQTAYEHRIKVSGGSYTSSGKITSTTSSRAVTGLSRGKTYVHQVRTYGQHADPSPWSAETSFYTGARPETSFTYPDGTDHENSTLTAQWTYYDLESAAQTGSRIELLQGSTTVYTATLGAVTEYALPVTLLDGTTYKARVQVQDASGLWSPWVEQSFTTNFIPPTTPTVTGSFDADAGTVTLTITNPPAGDGTVAPVYNQVFRDGALIGDNLPLNTTFTDYTPSTAGTNTYTVVTWSATPTDAESTPLEVVGNSCWCFVSGGTGYATVAKLRGGASVKVDTGRTKVLHQFVGREYPIEFTSTAKSRVYALSGVVEGFGASAGWAEWEAISVLPAPLLYRDPLGRWEWVSISNVNIEHSVNTDKARVTATLTVVESE